MRKVHWKRALAKGVFIIAVFAFSLVLGAKRAASQTCFGIPGVGNLQQCTEPFFYCGDLTYCIGFCCSGEGSCVETVVSSATSSERAST